MERTESNAIEGRLLAWAEILERAVTEVQNTISEIRSQVQPDPDPNSNNNSQEE